jgi:hypothetical protein
MCNNNDDKNYNNNIIYNNKGVGFRKEFSLEICL